eukprot:9210962-Lingulodinium_polyedra.AAC.1
MAVARSPRPAAPPPCKAGSRCPRLSLWLRGCAAGPAGPFLHCCTLPMPPPQTAPWRTLGHRRRSL